MRRLLICLCLSAVLFSSCNGRRTVLIWTDRPEFAFYANYFNASQNRIKVSVRYLEYPAAELRRTTEFPDIVVGSWLKNAATGTYFRSLNNLFGTSKLQRSTFYSRLLAIGREGRRQLLLPVSFNVPALIFSRDNEHLISNPFTIGFDEIKALSSDFNAINAHSFTNMGFSPLWNDDFLRVTAVLSGASFREATPLLAWNSGALIDSMNFIHAWTHEINMNNQWEEDFTFRYFVEPPERLVQSGRILFSYMESNDIFTLNEETKENLDFRWIMEDNRIPILENTVFLGITRRANSPRAAREFVKWFFRVDTQQQLLEFFRVNRINETVFGICGGFSALGPVTEQIFPRFYTNLLGRMPPADYLMAPNILPANWLVLKERVVLPYLHDRARSGPNQEVNPLERRLADWQRINR